MKTNVMKLILRNCRDIKRSSELDLRENEDARAMEIRLMRLLAAFLIILLFGCSSEPRLVDDLYDNGQLKVSGVVEDGKQEGVWRYFYADGTLKSEGAWLHDYQDGAWVYYYPNGKRKQAGNYASKLRHGAWTYWYDNEQMYCEGVYDADRQDAVWTYYREDGTPFSIGSFAKGIKQGLWQWFDETGALKTKGIFYDGLRVGPWLENGQLVDKGVPAGMQSVMLPQADGVSWGLLDRAGESVFTCVLDTAHVPAVVQTKRPNPDKKAAKIIESKEELIISAPNEPALTPVVHIDSLWTKREEKKVGKLVSTYSFAMPGDDDDEYSVSSDEREMQSDWLGKALPQTRFFQHSGDVVDLSDYVGKKSVTLIVMRGFAGQVCVYCSAQTRALAEQLEKFKQLNNEVIIVYPGPAETIPMFIKAVQSVGGNAEHMNIVLDVNLSLVKTLGIIKDLSKPTSIVVDKSGLVVYGYIGTNMGDRPSAKELLSVVKRAQ